MVRNSINPIILQKYISTKNVLYIFHLKCVQFIFFIIINRKERSVSIFNKKELNQQCAILKDLYDILDRHVMKFY